MSLISPKTSEILGEKEDSMNNLSLEQLFENDDLLKAMSVSSNYQKFSQ
jgi:hypothetical protein